MSDPATDLYSFLRNKDFTSGSSEDQSDASSTASAESSEPSLQSVDAFDSPAEAEPSSADSSPGGTEETVTLNFDDDDVGELLKDCSEATLNDAGFGIIQLDDSGTVQFFNAYESELSGVDPSVAEGKDFFTQLAPCSNNRLFRGRFQKGIRRGELDEQFEYTYTYKMRPTLVDVRLYRDAAGHNWILVRKR